jgi:hypothetical protein
MLHRRDAMLRLGTAAGGALSLSELLRADQARAAESQPTPAPKARSCIFLFMWGGQPQQDMWDMKPDTPAGVRSPFSPISTAVPGLFLGEKLPLTAVEADKLAIVRSLTHTWTDHQTSVHQALTGRSMSPPRIFPANNRRRTDFPGIGSLFSYLREPSDLPASFTIPRPVAHDGLIYAGTGAGFLGATHESVELGQMYNHVATGPRADADLSALPLTAPADVSTTRLQARRGLVRVLEDTDRSAQRGQTSGIWDSVGEAAFRLLQASSVRDALKLELESDATRDRYGRNEYGESFLTARRLVEAGVRIVTVNWMFITPELKLYNVWDAHGGLNDLEHGMTGYGMLNAPYCLPAFDRAYSALLADLSARGLLDETVVACVGEFGRTPRINGTNGRDHWPQCYSAVLAGGGIRGGAVYGSSDKQAAYVKENPATPADYLATVAQACGLDPAREVHDLEGRPMHAIDGEPIKALLA